MVWWKIALIAVGSLVGSFLAYVILCLLVFIVASLFFDHKKTYQKDSRYYRFAFNSATGMVLFFLNIHIKKEGFEKLPEGRFLLVGNHISNWDPIVQWYALRKIEKMAYISKPSNINIPFFGWTSLRLCFLPIDRTSARKAAETIEKAAELLKNDVVSVGVYPEGTRSKDGSLGKFHNSVFKIAQMANAPIVVVKTVGTNDPKSASPFKRTEVLLKVADVIPSDEVMDMRTSEIGERVAEKLRPEE